MSATNVRDERYKEAASLIRHAATVLRDQAEKQASSGSPADEQVRLQKLASIYRDLKYADLVNAYKGAKNLKG